MTIHPSFGSFPKQEGIRISPLGHCMWRAIGIHMGMADKSVSIEVAIAMLYFHTNWLQAHTPLF